MVGAVVAVMEGETTSSKPKAEFFMVEGMEGVAVVGMEGKPHQITTGRIFYC